MIDIEILNEVKIQPGDIPGYEVKIIRNGFPPLVKVRPAVEVYLQQMILNLIEDPDYRKIMLHMLHQYKELILENQEYFAGAK